MLGKGYKMNRYDRQISVSEFGVDSQKKLAASKILVVGAGGLASPVLQYLAGAGLGHIKVMDYDIVSVDNMHRQTIFRTDDLGLAKAGAAATNMRGLNPDCLMTPIIEPLTPDNIETYASDVDLVLDCADSFAVSYSLSDYCLNRLPLIHASVVGTVGYVGGFCYNAPSLRAVFPDLPKRFGSCAEDGVLGPIVGIIGSLQAQMTLAVITKQLSSSLGQLVTYDAIGGLDGQIEQITDAVELPYLHQHLFREYDLPAPKGILLYGPPGCGKTLIAKAVANSLAKKVAEASGDKKAQSFFINIKGPELLNKYVGETERQIRQIFQRAREKASEGWPVIVFFDEMESLFRTRGSGISSDMESTVVPQLLAEIDGVEGLRNVIVIGASNREDLIDPAILRPGRLDVKIKIHRPDESAASAIFTTYLTTDVPLDPIEIDELGGGEPDKAIRVMIERTVEEMYRPEDHNRFLEVTYQNGDKEVMYFKDFASGAMIENIVRRSKKTAIKRSIATGSYGIRLDDLLGSIRQEYKEHEDLPNTTNPDDWAKISGKKGERIIFIRTLLSSDDEFTGEGGRAIERVQTGQYL